VAEEEAAGADVAGKAVAEVTGRSRVSYRIFCLQGETFAFGNASK